MLSNSVWLLSYSALSVINFECYLIQLLVLSNSDLSVTWVSFGCYQLWVVSYSPLSVIFFNIECYLIQLGGEIHKKQNIKRLFGLLERGGAPQGLNFPPTFLHWNFNPIILKSEMNRDLKSKSWHIGISCGKSPFFTVKFHMQISVYWGSIIT